MKNSDPRQTIFYSIESAIKSYRRYAQKQLTAVVTDITVDQMLILTLLESQPDMPQNEMAALLYKDHASITRMIELLVKNKYLGRTINEQDRRKFKLNISTTGQDALKKLKPVIFQNRMTALDGISESELNQLFITLKKIIDNCNQ